MEPYGSAGGRITEEGERPPRPSKSTPADKYDLIDMKYDCPAGRKGTYKQKWQ